MPLVDSANAPAAAIHLCTAVPSPAERRLAALVVAGSALVFAAAAPWAQVPLAAQPVFVAVYQSALAINDLITAALLFGQFHLLRSRAVLLLGGGYLFTALVAVVHGLSFPGLFAAGGLLGASAQSTAWLYMMWHGAFPLAVIGYALLARREPMRPPAWATAPYSAAGPIGACIAAVVVLATGCALLATAGAPLLPAIMVGQRYTPAMLGVVTLVWALSIGAVAVLWHHRGRSVLDLWLLVTMCAWVFDIGLSAVLNAGRFDLGFYAGRLYGLLASSFVLLTLLTQTLRLYGQLAGANDALRDIAERDGLTRLFNRRHFDEALQLELQRGARERQPLSLLLIDVDHFKRFNDTHGHLAGDACLREVARQIAGTVTRAADMAARFGGEEFAALLPGTGPAGAVCVAEQIRRAVAGADHAAIGRVTVSIGTATLWPLPDTRADELIAAADRALYEAKDAGRNRVVPASFGPKPGLAA